MKTFETEKGNIPEGATHYFNEDDSNYFTWIAVDPFGKCWGLIEDEEIKVGAKPIPQTKEVEWVNGLPPVGVECVFVGIHNNYHCNVSIYHSDGNKIMFLGRVDGFPKESTIENFKDGIDLMVFYCRDGDKPFIPLESEAERKEREELEASYDLYCDFYQDHNPLHKTIESFECSRDKDLWLRTVRKTNYKVKGE